MKLRESVSVALVGHNTLIREGLKRILDEEEFCVEESLERNSILLDRKDHEVVPQLIILDDSGATDIDADVPRLQQHFPDSKIVILADMFQFDHMAAAFKAGVDGYIVKKVSCESLLGLLRLVAMGQKVLPSELADSLPEKSFNSAFSPDSRKELDELFSTREAETLRCLVMGYPNKVIAHRLGISEATVKVHVKAILRKLQIQNRTQAAIWAVNHGIDMSVPHPAEQSSCNHDDSEHSDCSSPAIERQVVAAE